MTGAAAIALVAGSTTAQAWDTPPPASSPFHELVAPAQGDLPARYRYFPRGNNPRFATRAAVVPLAVRTHRPVRAVHTTAKTRKAPAKRRCVFAPCSKTGKLAGQIAGIVANAIWRHAF